MNLKTGLHEVLFRYGRNRKLQGFHVRIVHQAVDATGAPILKENGEVMLESVSQPMTLARAIAEGLDLKDSEGILQETVAQALARVEEAEASAQAQKVELDQLRRELAAARKEAREHFEALQAALAPKADAPA